MDRLIATLPLIDSSTSSLAGFDSLVGGWGSDSSPLDDCGSLGTILVDGNVCTSTDDCVEGSTVEEGWGSETAVVDGCGSLAGGSVLRNWPKRVLGVVVVGDQV